MIATRFRTVGWVAGVAVAALGCYLVSLRVAAERVQVLRLDHQLFVTRDDINELGTELGTRSRLVQLERWNADVLALTAPKAGQYLAGEMQLASLATPTTNTHDAAAPGEDSLQAPPAIAKAAYRPADGKPATRLVHSVSLDLDTDDQTPAVTLLRRASLVGSGLMRAGGALLDGKPARP